MILSAPLTSVVINLGLCFLVFTLYSLLRNRPGNRSVYAPRLVDFNSETLSPSLNWVKEAWELSEEELLSKSGLDAVVFIRTFIFSLKVFAVAAIIGIFILLPVNFMGNQLNYYDFSDLPNKSLDSFSISNVNDGSNRLWIHFGAAYVFTAFVCYLLYHEYSYISLQRVSFFDSSKPQPGDFTILVSSIPSSGSGYSEVVGRFFQRYHPSTYLSHTVVHGTNKIQKLVEVPAAFVSFNSRFGAAIALNIQQVVNPTEWVTEQAPEPQDVYWPFFSASSMKRWICKLVAVVMSVALAILFLILVVMVQGLTHLDQLETWLPFLKGLLHLTFAGQVITGYLPSLIVDLFLYSVPPSMFLLSSIQGNISRSQIEKSACFKVWWFMVWNIFFVNVLSGTALYHVQDILEPKKIPQVLAEGVPAQASFFFIAHVVTSGWTNISLELFRLFPRICSFISRLFSRNANDELEVPSIPYHSVIPRIIFFGLLGITYFFLAPLILPFLLVYYCLGYIIYRNQLMNLYEPKYETGGKFWPIVHSSIIFSLTLMHIIAMGIFGLKKLPLASILTVPLPVLTLLFNEYCQKRFLPLFEAYPTECLVKKDRADQNDPSMTEFDKKLVTAYRRPGLTPVQYSGSIDGCNFPSLCDVQQDDILSDSRISELHGGVSNSV